MFNRNPVRTEKGIFRRDIWGNWWELEVRALQTHFSQNGSSGTPKPKKLSDVIKNLEGAVIAQNGDDESTLIVKGWKKVSAVQRVVEIEKSVNSGRTVLELDFI